MKLKGKIALVTGAAGGIGSEVARVFSSEGATIILADQATEDLALIAKEIGRDAMEIVLDVADEHSWKAAAAEIEQEFGRLDLLVNCAGISGFGHLDEIDYAFWSRFQRINADSVFHSIQALKHLLRRAEGGASIVNIGSTLALRTVAGMPSYAAAKAALRSLTKTAALHFAAVGENIRCNAIHPGSTRTPMMEANLPDDPELRAADLQRRMDLHPLAGALGRLIEPRDIALAALFLASDDAAFITGIDLPVDGGATIGN